MGDPRANETASSSGALTAKALTPERWQEIKEIFGRLLDSEASQRDTLLWKECGGDESLIAEVSSLLAAAQSGRADTSEVFKGPSPVERLTSSGDDPMLGRRIGDYRIEHRLGSGGMAAVYLASRADDQFRMLAAIKLLRPDPDREDLLQRFRNERQTLAALTHPNIVKLLDGGSTEEGLPYLVMDYVDGTPIDKYCDEHNLSIQSRLEIFLKVCGAVEYAHTHSVIHRDLKPNNILVTSDGIPKLLDFGIAKVLDPANASQAIVTRTANRHLTPAYASPEQVRGEAVTAATDIYSLGVILFSLLSGHGPYRVEQKTPAALERAICEQDPETPSSAVDRLETETRADGTTVTVTPEDISRTRERPPEKLRRRLRGDLDTIVLKTLQKEPQRRYRSVSEFVHDIQRHLQHKPIVARPSTLMYRASSFVRRHRTEVIVSALGAVVSLAAIVYSVWARYESLERTRIGAARTQSLGRHSIAVLGFRNLSEQPSTAWLSTALSEMLSTELAAGGKLRVIPGDNIARTRLDLSLSETDSLPRATLKRLSENLGTDYVLVGSYLDNGDTNRPVRFQLRLQDAALGETVALTDEAVLEASLPDAVTRIGADLRAKLGVSPLSPPELAGIRAALPANPDAIRYYAEGLEQLRIFNAPTARDSLEKAVIAVPSFSLGHSALADAWAKLGYDEKAKQEAARALDLSASLPREDRLVIEARARESTHEWDRAAQIYSALFEFFPDNIEYGLKLVTIKITAGNSKDALATIDALRKLPSPLKDDPRIDLQEEALSSFDPSHRQAALASAFRKATVSGSAGLLAAVKMRQGNWLQNSGDVTKALSSMDEARSLFTKIGDQNGVAQATEGMGDLYFGVGDWINARTMYQKALESYRQSGNNRGQAEVLSDLGHILAFTGQWDLAQEMNRESVNIARRLQDKRLTADILNNFSVLLRVKGEISASRAMVEEAMYLYREIGDQGAVGLESYQLCEILFAQGNLAAADRTCQQAAKAMRERNPDGAVHPLGALGSIRMSQGRFEEAKNYYERAAATYKKMSDFDNEGVAKLDLSTVDYETGDFKNAEALAREAAEEFHRTKSGYFEAYAQAVLGQSLVREGKISDARKLVAFVLDHTKAKENLAIHLSIAINAARLLTGLARKNHGADLVEATNLVNDALVDAKNYGYVGHEFDARLAGAEIKLKSGRFPEARKELTALEHDARAKGFMLIARKAEGATLTTR